MPDRMLIIAEMLGIDTRLSVDMLEREPPEAPPPRDQATLEAEFKEFLEQLSKTVGSR